MITYDLLFRPSAAQRASTKLSTKHGQFQGICQTGLAMMQTYVLISGNAI